MLSLHCCTQAFSNWGKWRLLTVLTSPWTLRCLGFSSVAHRLSCSTACGIFLDQRLSPSPLHWQADSYPLYHWRSQDLYFLNCTNIVWPCSLTKMTQMFSSEKTTFYANGIWPLDKLRRIKNKLNKRILENLAFMIWESGWKSYDLGRKQFTLLSSSESEGSPKFWKDPTAFGFL